jgi:hypothetical protein
MLPLKHTRFRVLCLYPTVSGSIVMLLDPRYMVTSTALKTHLTHLCPVRVALGGMSDFRVKNATRTRWPSLPVCKAATVPQLHSMIAAVAEQVLHDRVNLVRLVRHLEKSTHD